MKGIQPAVKALIEKFKKAKGVERDSIRAKIKDAIKRDPKDLKADIAKMMEIHPAMIGADILINTLMGILMEEDLIAEIGAGPVGSLEKIAQEYRSAKEGVEKEKLRAMARKMAQGKPEDVKKMIAGKMGIYPRMLGADTLIDRMNLILGEEKPVKFKHLNWHDFKKAWSLVYGREASAQEKEKWQGKHPNDWPKSQRKMTWKDALKKMNLLDLYEEEGKGK